MSLSYTEKYIYNAHLKTSRSYQNKPWRPRENFEKLPVVEEELIKKINSILNTKNIKPDDYVRAQIHFLFLEYLKITICIVSLLEIIIKY